jgi:hypothetical protein
MRQTILSLFGLLLLASPARADKPPNMLREEQVRQAQVVVVSGSADHMEQVLRRAQVRFVLVRPDELPNLPLHSQQVLMVNCRGEMSAAARDRVRRFVAAGGFLYTTDHAVHELVEKIFPGTVAWNRTTTKEQVFPMKARGNRGLLKHLGESATQKWQLAGGGYLIKVLDPHKVEVLMESPQVAERYGTGVLGVRFKHEDGYVIHVTGHFYTQPGQQAVAGSAGRAFEQLSENVVREKQADQGRIDGLYNMAPRQAVMLQAAPEAAAPPVPAASVTTQQIDSKARVKVLERKGSYYKVRDAQGNEGWAPAAAF